MQLTRVLGPIGIRCFRCCSFGVTRRDSTMNTSDLLILCDAARKTMSLPNDLEYIYIYILITSCCVHGQNASACSARLKAFSGAALTSALRQSPSCKNITPNVLPALRSPPRLNDGFRRKNPTLAQSICIILPS